MGLLRAHEESKVPVSRQVDLPKFSMCIGGSASQFQSSFRESSPISWSIAGWWRRSALKRYPEKDRHDGPRNLAHPMAGKKKVADIGLLEQAARQRLLQRCSKQITVNFRAAPAQLEDCLQIVSETASGAGALLSQEQVVHLRQRLRGQLQEAFAYSHHSSVSVRLDVEGTTCRIGLSWAPLSVAGHYDEWLETRQGTLFGAHADAMVLHCASALGKPADCPVLDLGAGFGRNALALARLGHDVTAVEPAPTLAGRMFELSVQQRLPVRVIQKNSLDQSLGLPPDHFALAVLSQVLPEMRDLSQVVTVLQKVARSLRPGGVVLLQVFIGSKLLGANEKFRQVALSNSSAFLTREELKQTALSLGFRAVSHVNAYRYERDNLRPEAWPPNPWFEAWSQGREAFPLPEGIATPLELEWVTWTKGN